jgi:hypothetical protein
MVLLLLVVPSARRCESQFPKGLEPGRERLESVSTVTSAAGRLIECRFCGIRSVNDGQDFTWSPDSVPVHIECVSRVIIV